MPLIGLSPNVPSAGLDPTSEKRIARVRISVKKMQRKNLAPSRLALAQQSLGQPGRRPRAEEGPRKRNRLSRLSSSLMPVLARVWASTVGGDSIGSATQ